MRAVAPGKYVRPQASVEDMYRPDRFGRTATESVEVTAGNDATLVIARSAATKQSRGRAASLDCFASLAMTTRKRE